MNRLLISAFLLVMTAACGVAGSSAKPLSSSQALISTAELLEFEPVAVRHELYSDVARQSHLEAGRQGAVLFPMLVEGEFRAAPALEAKVDLLSATDAGASVVISFERDSAFSEDRRDAFQGLSEREAAELIARSLVQQWAIRPTRPVTVVRAPGAPYAAAWIDGELRLNPSFVYMAAAPF